MTPADPLRFRGPDRCLEPLWLQSMIRMAEAAGIDPLMKTLEAR